MRNFSSSVSVSLLGNEYGSSEQAGPLAEYEYRIASAEESGLDKSVETKNASGPETWRKKIIHFHDFMLGVYVSLQVYNYIERDGMRICVSFRIKKM
ncbi:hypothetical protein R1flu_004833 [Riccia fluitans]|uniref:Uncharacterized protein n=1 Tax=Riccia fluitans TaxID=41844 RepID=A0ABD1YUB0_9MARC